MRCLDGADADPLGVRPLVFNASSGVYVAVLLIVLMIIVGLAWRAGLYGRTTSVVDGEGGQQEEADCGFFDTCARSFVLVFFCLLGLMALGLMYGNVLGAAHASP